MGYFTKRTAEAWLRPVLDDARRGVLPGEVRTGVTFETAADEWLRFIEEDRERKPSTVVDYRSALRAHLLPAFGDRPIEAITTEDIEAWRRSLSGLSNRSKNSHGGDGRIKTARFPARKTLEEFDFTFQRSVKKTIVEHPTKA